MSLFLHWNHRVVVRQHNGEPQVAIHEVYYDEQGLPASVTAEPVYPAGESLSELRDELEYMLAACKKPVLDYDKDFPAQEGGRL